MPTHLYLMRHGRAVPHGTPGIVDDDRPLTRDGCDRVVEIAEGLGRLGVEPNRIVTSPLPRAQRTAELVAEGLGLSDVLENSDALRQGVSAGSIRDWLRSREDASLMIVGHDPAFSELLGLLIGVPTDGPNPFALKKGGVASLSVLENDRYQFEWLATPRLLRRLAD